MCCGQYTSVRDYLHHVSRPWTIQPSVGCGPVQLCFQGQKSFVWTNKGKMTLQVSLAALGFTSCTGIDCTLIWPEICGHRASPQGHVREVNNFNIRFGHKASAIHKALQVVYLWNILAFATGLLWAFQQFSFWFQQTNVHETNSD